MFLGSSQVIAVLSSFLSLVRAANFNCICEAENLNGCSRSYSCRLNSTIDYNATVPDWVTDAEEALFINTIDDAVNGLLRPPFFSLGRMTWEAAIACDDDDGVLTWYPQQSQCRATLTREDNVTESRRRYHGWASLGFHPMGKEPGTWLTQIMGEIDDPDGDGDSHLVSATCADTGLYVSVDYINATQPYDPRFSPAGGWGMLYLHSSNRVYPVGAQGVPSYRTDGDLINYGVDLNCTGFDTSGRVCQEPKCFQPANITHFKCPVGTNTTVGGANCSRRYAGVADDSGAMEIKGNGVVWLLVAGLLVLGVASGI
jgi:hypothetical protein